MRREIETGPIVAALGAALLLASLFFDWYGRFSGWHSFEVLDLALAAAALAALAGAASRLGAPRWVSDRMLPAIGAGVALVVVAQMLQHPPLGIERELAAGPWLALVGAGLVLAGGVLALAHVSFALQVRERRSRPAPAPAPPPAESAEPAPAPAPAPAPQGGSLWQAPPPQPTEPRGKPVPPPPGAEPAAPDDDTQRLPGDGRAG